MRPIEKRRYWRLRREKGRPLYLQIRDLVLEHIQSGLLKPGDLLPGYPWLSTTMGVADKTVRQAYEVLRQAGVLDIKRGKGTYVAFPDSHPGAKGPGTGVIGIVPPSFPVPESEHLVFWKILQAIQEAAYDERLDTLLLAKAGDLRSAHALERVVDRKRMDGLLILTPPGDEFLGLLAAQRFPTVLVGSSAAPGTIDSMAFDFEGAGRDLTYRLIGEGHKRIGFLRLSDGTHAADMDAGYRHAMGAAGLSVSPEWIASVNFDTGEQGFSTISALLEKGVSAVLASDERLALTVAKVARQMNINISKELSLVAPMSSAIVNLADEQRLSGIRFDPVQFAKAVVVRLGERMGSEDNFTKRENLEGESIDGMTVSRPGSLILN